LQTYIVSYQVTVEAHSPEEAEDLAPEFLDTSMGAATVEEDWDADPVECYDCPEDE
jgi:hypothetical protein